jgi:release factor glutamine methyltransferase
MADIRTIIQQTTREFTACGSSSPRLDAELLLMHFLKVDRVQLFIHQERELSEEERTGFSLWSERRCKGEPVAYITGVKEFWSLVFEVNREVLIPRPETECLVEEVMRCCGQESGNLRIIDIGTGSGAIAVVLSRELSGSCVVATDISRGALAIARKNAVSHGVAERIEFLEGELFALATGEFDMIVSNPPYIPDHVYPLLPAGIREFEPRQALVAGPDGTLFHREIIQRGLDYLKAGGWICMEIGEGQRNLVDSLLRETGAFEEIHCRQDYGGLDRVVAAKKTTAGAGAGAKDERWTRS